MVSVKDKPLSERVHSTFAAMGGGGVWPLRMYAFYRPNVLLFQEILTIFKRSWIRVGNKAVLVEG